MSRLSILRAPSLPLRTAALSGAAVVAGWVLHDVLTFLSHRIGPATLDLLPAASLAIAGGALVACLFALVPLLPAIALAGALAAAVTVRAFPLPLARAEQWLPPALALLILAWGVVARALHPRARRVVSRAALAGFLACAALTGLRLELNVHWWLFTGTALAVLALGFVPRAALRRAASLAAVLPLAFLIAREVRAGLRLRRPDLAPPAEVRRGGPNLLLIVLDTVRADHLSAYGHERPTTPVLDAFAREHATLHTEARATSPFTLASHASLFTGLFPAEHGACLPQVSSRPIRADVPTLAERLRAAGYRTAAIVANAVYVNPIYGLDRGFERFDSRGAGGIGRYFALAQMLGHGLHVGHKSYREARAITSAALDWLDEGRGERESFCLFLNYMDAHIPYLPPPPFDRAFSDERPADPHQPPQALWPLLYDREIGHIDDQLGRLFDGLEERGLFEDTVVIVTSDHGEDLEQHGIQWHCWQLYDSLVRVPLFVKPAGPRRAERDERLITSADVHDLALRELGFETKPSTRSADGWIGEWHPHDPISPAVLRWAERIGLEARSSRVAWLEGRRKYIVSSSGKVEAFDLERDPDELAPLLLTPEERAAALERGLGWYEGHPAFERAELAAPVVDEELLRDMEALGYGG